MSDLHAYDVVYHQRCSVNFRTGRNVPTDFRGKVDPSLLNPVNISGCPESSGRNDAFLKTCDYLEENSEKVFSLAELAGCYNARIHHSRGGRRRRIILQQ